MRSCSVSGNFFPFFNDNSVVFMKVHQKRRQIEVTSKRSKSPTVFVANGRGRICCYFIKTFFHCVSKEYWEVACVSASAFPLLPRCSILGIPLRSCLNVNTEAWILNSSQFLFHFCICDLFDPCLLVVHYNGPFNLIFVGILPTKDCMIFVFEYTIHQSGIGIGGKTRNSIFLTRLKS